MSEHETIADIIAEKRRRADEIERDVAEKMKRGEMVSDCYARELVADIRREADRFEAALKRERGDCAKLREAIDYLCERMADMDATFDPSEVECLRAALAAPPRNCDMGTAMEQGERFAEYCREHKHPESDCLTCPLLGQTGGYCELAWAQLPYKAGGAK